jgi:hypothetical protein
MALSESDVNGADQQTGINPIPTAEQKRILRLMLSDDLIWEVLGKSHRSIYNERLGRPQRIPASLVEAMEQQGWIRRLPTPTSLDQRYLAIREQMQGVLRELGLPAVWPPE